MSCPLEKPDAERQEDNARLARKPRKTLWTVIAEAAPTLFFRN